MNKIGSQYNDNEFEANYPEGMENYFWTFSRNLILHTELIKNNLTQNKILEIGCGKGLVIKALRKKGLNIWGCELGNVEPLPEIADYIYQNIDCHKLSVDFRLSINTIMLLDVIEHIEFPKQFLISILENYPNVNHIYITVPSRMELWSSYDVFYRHYTRYNFKLMKELTENLKIKIIDIGYLYRLLYFPALIAALSTGKRNHKVIAPKSKIKIFIHRLIAYLLYMDYKIFNKKIAGSSLYCLVEINPT